MILWQKREHRDSSLWRLRFAYLPVWLEDAGLVWWEPYWYRYSSRASDECGNYLFPIRQRYAAVPPSFNAKLRASKK